MLTIPEEFLLLSHNEKSGAFLVIPDLVLSIALGGAALMDLALRDRIDTDLSKLVLVDGRPTGEKALDLVLDRIREHPEIRSTAEWLDLLRRDGPEIYDLSVARLVERGILRQEAGRILWVFATRRYPLIDGKELQEVKLRIATLLMSNDIPDPRDVVIIALAQACGLLRRVFSESELKRAEPRIEQISRLDLVGQAMRSTMEDLQDVLASAAGRGL